MKKFDFDFYKNRKILFGISIGLMVIGLIFNFIRGTKMDIQFVGGAMIKYSVDEAVIRILEYCYEERGDSHGRH